LKSSNKKSCSLFQTHHNHILFEKKIRSQRPFLNQNKFDFFEIKSKTEEKLIVFGPGPGLLAHDGPAAVTNPGP
jgi:hypothetical protein